MYKLFTDILIKRLSIVSDQWHNGTITIYMSRNNS